jgi:hypothetical protein
VGSVLVCGPAPWICKPSLLLSLSSPSPFWIWAKHRSSSGCRRQRALRTLAETAALQRPQTRLVVLCSAAAVSVESGYSCVCQLSKLSLPCQLQQNPTSVSTIASRQPSVLRPSLFDCSTKFATRSKFLFLASVIACFRETNIGLTLL